MKKADPNLVRRRIYLKMDLTKEQKAKRKSAAEKLWRLFQGKPDILSRVYFIDECKNLDVFTSSLYHQGVL
jgi:DNA helicase TIP49 (TBP-interacting protein)